MDQKHICSGSVGDHVDSKREEINDDELVVVVTSVANNDIVEYNSKAKESCVLDLPLHILEMIMKINSVDEYINYRATCKWFHLATPLTKMKNQTVRKRLQIYSSISPWLIELDKERGIIFYKHSMIGDKYIKGKFPALWINNMYFGNASINENFLEWIDKVCYSMFGWWLCYDTKGDLFFFNPFTFDTQALPSVYHKLKSLCFSEPPTSPYCMTVGFSECNVFIHCAREKSWRVLRLDLRDVNLYSQRFNAYSPTFDGRDLYVLCKGGQLNVFRDLGQQDYSLLKVVAAAPESCCRSRAQYYLMKCDEMFLLVIVDEYGNNVEVFTVNTQNSAEKWKRTSCLGKHMIYICGVSSFCIEAKSPELENKIYFPQLHDENGKIVFYSLESCMYHTFTGKKIDKCFGNLSKTIHPRFPCAWTDPSFP